MKLWKIMLAVLACVLMLSAVAMAETHVCADTDFQKIVGTETKEIYGYKNLGTATAPNYVHSYIKSWQEMCTKCGAVKNARDVVENEACSINWGNPVEATCTTKRHQNGSCSVCGQKTYIETGDFAKHYMKEGQVHQATCETPIWRIDTCLVCGYSEKVTHGGLVDCVYVEKKISDATCKAPKKVCEACQWCGDVKDGSTKEVGEKTGHDYAWTVTIEPTCITKGVKTGVCKVCGDKGGYAEVAALGHKADYSTLKTVNATCTAWGKVTADCYVCGVNFKVEDKAPIDHKDKIVNVAYKAATCGYPGNEKYSYCSACGVMWDRDGRVITEVPVYPANGQHILPYNKTAYVQDCTSSANYAEGNCEVCGLYTRVYIPAAEHSWPAAINANLVNDSAKKLADCVNAGHGNIKCQKCNEYKYVTVPATGHNFKVWTYGPAATCTADFIAYSTCANGNCGFKTEKVIEEALGHNWILQDGGKDATCTEAGQGTRMCTRCKNTQQNVTIPAKGHDYSKTIEVVKPTCEAQGYTVFGCVRCDATQKGNYTAALGHNYSWVVVTKPSEAGNGKNEYTCSVCKKVSDTKTVKYTKYYYNNTMTSFGPTTKELVGGNDWYRVTPVDVTVDGVYTYDLIASNKYVVGTVTISVNAGTLTVSYKVKGNVDVKDESLLIYASKADLATGSAVTAPVGAAINVAETFGADGKVLVSLILTGDYDAAGKDLVNDAAAAGMIANID